MSVSATTRQPRPGEVDGVSYFFHSPEEFQALVDAGEMLESATYSGHLYGTPRGPVLDHIAAGQDVILEIDVQGARQVRASMPEALLVFLAPPSWEELELRLRGRGTEDQDALRRRLDTARQELEAEGDFDRVIVNDDVGRAVAELVVLGSIPS